MKEMHYSPNCLCEMCRQAGNRRDIGGGVYNINNKIMNNQHNPHALSHDTGKPANINTPDVVIEGKLEEFKRDYAENVYRVNACKIEDFTVGFQKWLRQSITDTYRAREEEREEMFKILIESMPRDAENLSSLTGEQARTTIQNFIKYFTPQEE